MEEMTDWEIDADGFYVATRSFLIRRGSCCANQCRHCPYINWHRSLAWQPLPAEVVQVITVPRKAMEGARKALSYHEQAVRQSHQTEEVYHRAMIDHYRLLLARWEIDDL